MPRDDAFAGDTVIRSSQPKWFKDLALAYKNRKDFVFVDDANTGFDPNTETLLYLGCRIGVSKQDWQIALACFGVGGMGFALIYSAIRSSEPTSKLNLLVATGAILTIGGGFTGMAVLTRTKPPNIKLGSSGLEIRWT